MYTYLDVGKKVALNGNRTLLITKQGCTYQHTHAPIRYIYVYTMYEHLVSGLLVWLTQDNLRFYIVVQKPKASRRENATKPAGTSQDTMAIVPCMVPMLIGAVRRLINLHPYW